MDNRPIVAVVGRPNVGKSTLFNKLAGKRISIVEDTPGVTRDRIFTEVEWLNKYFTLIDTGGIEPENDDIILTQMRNQAMLAMDMAHVIVFVVDGKSGITSADREVGLMLRKTNKPVILAVNKIDNMNLMDNIYDFYELGLGEPHPISSANAMGLGDLLDVIVENFPEGLNTEYNEDIIRVAITGKPNAGKSSLTNLLLGEKRVAVSSIAGTTRDAIEVPFNYNNKKYTIIDTAGLRKKSKIEPSTIEKYSAVRSLDAITRADIVLLVVDAKEGLTEQDVKIAGLIHEQGKPSVVVINKWDLIEKDTNTMSEFKKKLEIDLAFMGYFVPVFISCLERQRTGKVMETAEKVYLNASREIAMGLFNNVLTNAISVIQPPYKNGRRFKINYGKQTGTNPPTFTIYCNDASLVDNSYSRYLENAFRKAFDFSGTPIKINFQSHNAD